MGIASAIHLFATLLKNFEGGGHVMGSAHPGGGAYPPTLGRLLENCPILHHAFACDYCLPKSSLLPAENSFLADLLDALAGYDYLI